jgi:hypothetical protein
MINAAHSGDNLVLWGTGLGAVSGDETQPPSASNFADVQVLIENQPAVVSYAGRSSSPGLDQINVVVPAGISGGCKTSVAVIVNGVSGNVVSTSIAPAGQSVCGDTNGALTNANLQKAISTGFLNIGGVDLTRYGSLNNDILLGDFATYPLNSLIRSYAGNFGPSLGNCVAYEVEGSSLTILDPVFGGLAKLDAGASLTVSSGGKSMTMNALSTGEYEGTLGTPSSIFLTAGTYSVSNGNGGSQVPAFNWSATLPGPLSAASLPATINRAQDLTVTWSGGGSFSAVGIIGYAGVPISSGLNSYVEFVCSAPANAGQFTIPSAILRLLPTNGYGSPGVAGAALQIAGVVDNRFTVSGSPGLDAGTLTVFTSFGVIAKVE